MLLSNPLAMFITRCQWIDNPNRSDAISTMKTMIRGERISIFYRGLIPFSIGTMMEVFTVEYCQKFLEESQIK